MELSKIIASLKQLVLPLKQVASVFDNELFPNAEQSLAHDTKKASRRVELPMNELDKDAASLAITGNIDPVFMAARHADKANLKQARPQLRLLQGGRPPNLGAYDIQVEEGKGRGE